MSSAQGGAFGGASRSLASSPTSKLGGGPAARLGGNGFGGGGGVGGSPPDLRSNKRLVSLAGAGRGGDGAGGGGDGADGGAGGTPGKELPEPGSSAALAAAVAALGKGTTSTKNMKAAEREERFASVRGRRPHSRIWNRAGGSLTDQISPLPLISRSHPASAMTVGGRSAACAAVIARWTPSSRAS